MAVPAKLWCKIVVFSNVFRNGFPIRKLVLENPYNFDMEMVRMIVETSKYMIDLLFF